jgi:uncharacterized repeat protein (TIGR03837 family)
MQTTKTWDIFCKVIDNFGDIGVCWRLACGLAARGQQVRLWVDDASALGWIAPQGASGVQVRAWTAQAPQLGVDMPGDVVIEAFACEVDAAWVAGYTSSGNTPEFIASLAIEYRASAGISLQNTSGNPTAPVWINLEYLSAETFAQRSHGLPSPVMSGPAVGLTKWFYYPGFTPRTGGLLREDDLLARQARFKPRQWLQQMGLDDAPGHHQGRSSNTGSERRGEQTFSLFCYEPEALKPWLEQLARGPQHTRLLVTHGRAAAAVQACVLALQQSSFVNQIALQPNKILREQLLLSEHLSIHYLPALTQPDYDHLLWSCQFNCVRGEDSLVRALWAGQPFVWHIYPQDDGAHAAKLDAFLDWLQAPADLRLFHQVWNGLSAQPLPAVDVAAWGAVALAARERLLAQSDAATQLMAFAEAKSGQC